MLTGIRAASAAGANIVCFPECCLKGMRGTDFVVEAITASEHDSALEAVRAEATSVRMQVILPTERPWQAAWQNGAYVIDADGTIAGYQSKNQVPLEEEPFFVPGSARQLFHAGPVPFGIVICHEGWRYPETVRWAAVRGARIVFHPHFSGFPDGFPDPEGVSYYEHAKVCRAGENHIWFASVNFALPVQDCTTSVTAPDGSRYASSEPKRPALLVAEIDPVSATGYLAQRFAPERYR